MKRNFPFVIRNVSSCIRCQCKAGPGVLGAMVSMTAPMRLSVFEPSSMMRILTGPISRISPSVDLTRDMFVVPAMAWGS